MNFKSNSNYKKWLSYGHASGEFAKTPGNQPVSINGKSKQVNHGMNMGGNLFSMGGKNYIDGGEVDAFGNPIEEFPKPAEMNIEGTDTKGLGMSTPMNGNQQNYISQPSTRQPTQNSGTGTQGELENAGMIPQTTDDPTNESKDIAGNALKSGLNAGMKTGNPLIGLGVAAAGFAYNKFQQGMNQRKEDRQEDMAAAEFEKAQQMNSTYADPNSAYYSAADGAAITGDKANVKKGVKVMKAPDMGTASQESKNAFNYIKAQDQKAGYKSTVDSSQVKKPAMASGGNVLKPGGETIQAEMSTNEKVKSDATSLFKMMTDMIIPAPKPRNVDPQLPKPFAASPADAIKNKVKLTSAAKAGVKAIR